MHHTSRLRAAMRLPLLAVAVLALVTHPAQAREVVLRPAPDSKWLVNYGESSCRLLRDFGIGEEHTLLMMEQFAPGSGFSLMLAGTPTDEFARDRTVMLSFGPDPLGPRQVHGTRSHFGDFGGALIWSSVYLDSATADPETDEDAEMEQPPHIQILPELTQQVDRLQLTSGGDTLRLDGARLGEAMATLNQCSLARLTEWGLDRDKHLTMTRPATADNFPEIARAVAQGYPRAALRMREQANLHLRLLVDEQGAISDCRVTDMTQTQNISTTACDDFARLARFEPALDAAGQPMKSFYATNILFRTTANRGR